QTPLDRLFALGIDAYSLVYMITRLRGNPDQSHHGATGVIRIDQSGRVLRDISWATFDDGNVTLLPRPVISSDD
ncbi:MAG: penicillin-binding protein activator, partial [Pseudomonadota bacterium]|nr:penicillin-binding protein activator [Pseudomonadota bacterium]